MRLLVWPLRAAVFFTLFAFALNNQHETTLHGFFGHAWRAPTVFVVLGAFALGCAFGVLAMVPSWWRQRRVAQHGEALRGGEPQPVPAPPAAPVQTALPPPDGV